jgi:hypothetical protein
MQEVNQNKSVLQKLLGEFSWGRNLLWATSVLCFIDAVWTSSGPSGLIRDGAFHSALLFGIAGYLSEIRYRFIPESRNN